MSLSAKQAKFAYDLGLLLTEGLLVLRRIYPSARLRMGEGYIGDSIGPDETTPHLRRGGHFKRLAQDLVLDIEGQVVASSEHPAWGILDGYWLSLDPENRTGRLFDDANHFSRIDKGVI